MNRSCHCIVFNRARGQLMAVAETASSSAGGPGQHARGGTRKQGRGVVHVLPLRATSAATGLAVALFMAVPLGMPSLAHAQIVADPTAPAHQRPTVLQDSTVRPQVNIQTPSAGGVSRNTYSQFDVQSKGAVLNNDRVSNPFLSAGSAKVILNEVNSTNPSLLNGPITVNGTRAQVIVANPAGIRVDGGSFINASRATLTTGTAVMDNGTLSGFDVRKGTVEINGKGLNVQNVPYTDVLARAAKLTGSIQAGAADEIAVITGPQTVSYTTSQLTANAGTGAKPTLAIDTSALGGMYAGKITLLATEAGVGVRNAGKLQGHANGTSQLIVTADGRLENTGTLSAAVTSVATVRGDIVNVLNTGVIKGSNTALVSAGGDLRLSGNGLVQDTAGPSALILQAQRDIIADGARLESLGSSKASNGAVTSGQVTLSAARGIELKNGSTIKAHGDVRASSAGAFSVDASTLSSTVSDVVALSAQSVSLMNSTLTGQRVQVETGSPFSSVAAGISVSGGSLRGARQVTLMATGDLGISNLGKEGIQSGGNISLAAGGWLNVGSDRNAGLVDHVSATGSLVLSGNQLVVAGARLRSGGDMQLEALKEGQTGVYLQPADFDPERQSPFVASLNAGGNLTISALRSGLLARALEATGKNIYISSHGGMQIQHFDDVTGAFTRPLASYMTAKNDLVLADVHPDGFIQVSGSSLGSGGTTTLRAVGWVSFEPAAEKNGTALTSTLHSGIYGANVDIQGDYVTVKAASITANNGNALVAANKGHLSFGDASGGKIMLTASGNAAFHANSGLWLTNMSATAGGSLSVTSATAGISALPVQLTAADVLSFSSKTTQRHTGGVYKGGAVSLYTDGGLEFNAVNASAIATKSQAVQKLSGLLALESAQGMQLNGATTFQGKDIALNAKGNYVLDLGKDAKFMASHDLAIVGNMINLLGSDASAGGKLSIAAATGLDIRAAEIARPEGGYTNTYWDLAKLSAKEIDLKTAGNLGIDGLDAYASGALSMISGQNLTVAGKVNRVQSGVPGKEDWYRDEESLAATSITGMGGVVISAAGGTLDVSGANLNAGQANMLLQAQNDLQLRAAFTQRYMSRQRTTTEHKGLGLIKETTTRYYTNVYTDATPATLKGNDIRLEAGRDVTTEATKLTAGHDFRLDAGGRANYKAVRSEARLMEEKDRRSSLNGIIGTPLGVVAGQTVKRSSTRSTEQTLTEFGSLITTQNDIVSISGDDQLLQGTQLTYGGTATFGFGPNAKTGAKIILEGVKQTVGTVRTKDSDYVVWQKQSGSGSTIQTLTLPSFNGPTKPVFNGPVLVQLPAGDFKTQIQNLSVQPGLGYLNDLSKRPDVQWQAVKLAYEKWDYKQEGLTPAGAALIAAAITAMTGGSGAQVGATLVSASTATGAAIANAAFASLASQAAITFINNKGDIGKTLKDMGRSETVKAAVAAAVTAGVMEKLGALDSMQALKKTDQFTDKLTYNLINAGGRSLTSTAITGGDLADAFKGAIIGAAVDTAHGFAASEIKALEADYIAHKLAHALAGCVAGVAAQGTCKDGAIGAAVGEIVAGAFQDQKPGAYATQEQWNAYDNKVLGYSKIIAGAVAAYQGGNAQTAITTAETAVRNNFLTFNENQLRKQATQACRGGNTQACADEKRWDALDTSRDAKVLQVCSASPASTECNEWRDFALLARDSYSGLTQGRQSVLDLAAFKDRSDAVELQSIQRLINAAPYAYLDNSPHVKELLGIVTNFIPIVGDAKTFYEAKDPWDYSLAVVGALGPVGDATSAAIKAAKIAREAGDLAETAVQLKKAEQLAQNALNGKLFEGSGLQAMGLQKNTTRVSSVGRNGETITIVPDAAIDGMKGTFVEFKNVVNITDTSQFRGYAASNQPVILIVSTRTETISKSVWDAIQASKGRVIRFDPATGSKTVLQTRPGA